MNKTRVIAFVVVALVAMALPFAAYAQGPSGTYASGISCVNLGSSQATYNITFYDDTGAQSGQLSGTISAGGNVQYFTPNVSEIPSGFLGSAVVSSDQPVACSVNTQTSSGTTRVGTSNGVSSDDTGTTLYATQVLNDLGGFTSYVAVQNASDSAADVTATFYDNSGSSVHSETVNIPGNSSHVFYQDDGNLSAGFIGSATFEAVDGTTPLAGTVNFYNDGSSADTAQFLSYNTFTSGANTAYLPRLVKNISGVGYTSGFSCQNLGPGSVDLEMNVTFTDQSDNSTVTATLTRTGLSEGQAWAAYLGNATGTALDGVSRGYGSAVVTTTGGTGTVACTVNEDVRAPFANAGQGSTYSGIPDGEQSNTMFFPQVVALGSGSFEGGFQIANTTGTAATCDYEFSDGTTVTGQALAANGSNSVFAPNHVSSFNGSVTVNCDQPIVGIYNLTIFGGDGDPFATNNGVNQ